MHIDQHCRSFYRLHAIGRGIYSKPLMDLGMKLGGSFTPSKKSTVGSIGAPLISFYI